LLVWLLLPLLLLLLLPALALEVLLLAPQLPQLTLLLLPDSLRQASSCWLLQPSFRPPCWQQAHHRHLAVARQPPPGQRQPCHLLQPQQSQLPSWRLLCWYRRGLCWPCLRAPPARPLHRCPPLQPQPQPACALQLLSPALHPAAPC
jgi:hypothetical protein